MRPRTKQEAVAFVTDYEWAKGGKKLQITRIAVLSVHGAFKAIIQTNVETGEPVSIYSDFMKATWSREPHLTTNLACWEHEFVEEVQTFGKKRRAPVHQLDPALYSKLARELGIEQLICSGVEGTDDLEAHWCLMEGSILRRGSAPASPPSDEDDLHDLISQGPVNNYANDTSFGIF